MPKPKQIPWLRKRCQIRVAKDAASREADTRKEPKIRVVVVPSLYVEMEMSGEMSNEQEIDRPPINP
jgi:hypothetical protein